MQHTTTLARSAGFRQAVDPERFKERPRKLVKDKPVEKPKRALLDRLSGAARLYGLLVCVKSLLAVFGVA